MKFVSPLSNEEKIQLHDINHISSITRVRQRSHAILLSDKKYTINQLSDIFEVDRDTVRQWIDQWELYRVEGLKDKPKSGRPPKLKKSAQNKALELAKESPRQIKLVLHKIEKLYHKTVSPDWIKRLLKKNKYSWKRIRKSLKDKRKDNDLQAEFKKAQQELHQLQQQENHGLIDLYYFDQAGFSLTPVVPYAWQKIGEHILLPTAKSKRLNVLGFLTRKNQFTSFIYEGSVTSNVVIACMNKFAQSITKTTYVVIDNASTHTSKIFKKQIPLWKKKGLIIKQIPKYSPELNLIEILWRKIKYYWLPFAAYLNFENLKKELENILVKIGSKYRITFA